jgi:AcrR family transcriptional regulator
MTSTAVQEAKSEVVRGRVLDTVCDLIASGADVTFTKLAAAAGIPERTIYRYFPNRQALIDAVFGHVNRRIGFDGDPPRTPAEMTAMVRQVFPGFDSVAPIIDELLASSEGRRARLADVDQRRRAATAVVTEARPDLDPDTLRRIAAVVQVLGTAAVWRALRDFWEMDGAEAAIAVSVAINELLANPDEEE